MVTAPPPTIRPFTLALVTIVVLAACADAPTARTSTNPTVESRSTGAPDRSDTATDAKKAAWETQEQISALRRMAEQGNVAAQMSLGNLYSDGTVVPRDDNEAFKWLLMAAQQGLVEAQARVATLYELARFALLIALPT